MKTFNKLLLAAIVTVACMFSANAQLKYANGRLTLDTAPFGTYKVTLAGNGAYFNMPSQSNFFQIDIASDKTRLAGHGDEIVFYNSSTNKYNSIRVLNVYYHSDARAKTNIMNFNRGLDVINQLRPVTYNFINEGQGMRRSSQQEIGLLAQEVESIIPGAVITDDDGSMLINYNALIPVLIDAVKTLQAEVDALKAAR